ncbi:beta-N-acetylhexosaminidase [Guyparkeria hydrothermalis]|uniref:beta-N-acetylhexosaminidase n=1 Tax=Guyparkeria hydrothermalis TaxID=923 RepID=UPI002020C967|nr:beta-N-acetylhexosaminidase [Guyparkeria hydrothermalis]MCL7744457.1 beta-N-acetylhexosaminidase [Guyparkeria hydrothermalis]
MTALGPLMIDLVGPEVTAADRRRLQHPSVGGVILFARHFESRAQLKALIEEIRSLRRPHLLVAVDQEGGRVQRFKEDGFLPLPAMGRIGDLFDKDRQAGLEAARSLGWLMATQLREVGVDLSFAPVLDLDRGISGVIGDRAFDERPEAVIALAIAWTGGMREAGMAAVGKHYPGHGAVAADSHIAHPVDTRSLATMEKTDLRPFRAMAERLIPGLMVSHVIYPEVDERPAGFSPVWVREILREQWGYEGAVFSDDLTMAAASAVGEIEQRVEQCLAAGVDMALICNHPELVDRVQKRLEFVASPQREARLARMFGHGPVPSEERLARSPRLAEARQWIERLGVDQPDLFPDRA